MYHNPTLCDKWHDKYLHRYICVFLRTHLYKLNSWTKKHSHLRSLYKCFSKLSSKGNKIKIIHGICSDLRTCFPAHCPLPGMSPLPAVWEITNAGYHPSHSHQQDWEKLHRILICISSIISSFCFLTVAFFLQTCRKSYSYLGASKGRCTGRKERCMWLHISIRGSDGLKGRYRPCAPPALLPADPERPPRKAGEKHARWEVGGGLVNKEQSDFSSKSKKLHVRQ